MNGPICFIWFLLASFAGRRKVGKDARLKCNQRVAAVGEGFDKKLDCGLVVILGGAWWRGTRQTLSSEEAP
jgi:hypothetical protein